MIVGWSSLPEKKKISGGEGEDISYKYHRIHIHTHVCTYRSRKIRHYIINIVAFVDVCVWMKSWIEANR